MKYLFLIILLFSIINAQSISNVTGAFEQDSSVVISGSSFGTKSTSAPYKWDNFQDGTDGAQVGNGWYVYGAPSGSAAPSYSDDIIRGASNRVVDQSFTDGNYAQMFGVTDWFTTTYYLSFWMYYYPLESTESRNFKVLGFRTTNSEYAPGCSVSSELCMPDMRWDTYPATGSGHHYISGPQGTTPVFNIWGSNNAGGTGPVTINTAIVDNSMDDDDYGIWQRVEFWFSQGTYGNNDGESRCWRHKNGNIFLNWDFSGFPANNSIIDSNAYDGVYITRYQALDTYTPSPEAHVYLDEVYFDNTLARVEIGNNSVFANCSHREIQIPSAWSASEITVTFNQGSFSAEDQVYVFVVDSDGDVSPGYVVTIGAEGSGEAPVSGTGAKCDVENIEKE